MRNKYKSVELFAGAGGLALGLEEAGFKHICLNEIDKFAVSTLRANRSNWNVVNLDVKELAEKDCCKFLKIKKGKLDLLSGGFPCQTFSYAGKKAGINDARGTMFFYYASILKKMMPKIFLAENVKGLSTHDNGKTIKIITDIFSSIGYCVRWKILNAWDYEVAQKRERIVIVGVRNDIKTEYHFPEKLSRKLLLKDVLVKVPASDGIKYSDEKRRVLDLVPPGGCWRNLPKDVAKKFMKGSYYLGGGKTGVARRLSWNEPSLTLTCSPCQGQTERCHPDETRPLTIREYARIQNFPDNWIFQGSVYSQYKQIGNAVPINFAKQIGLSIIKFLEKNK